MSFLIIVVFLATAGQSSAADSATQPWFAFSYDDGWGTQIDTYRGTLTKDPAVKTIPFALSAGDIDSIRQKAVAIRVLEIPEPHPDFGQCEWGTMKPIANLRLMVSLGSETRIFSWQARPGCYGSDDWKRLTELHDLIWRITTRQPEYRSLPRGPRRAM